MNTHPERAERRIDALFQTRKGVVVRLTDGRALAPDGAKYSIFGSLEEYRRFAQDDTAWPPIANAPDEADLPAAAKILLYSLQAAVAPTAASDIRGAVKKARIFVACAPADADFAGRIAAALEARGFETLIDRAESYALVRERWQRVDALIARVDTVVFVLSPDAVASELMRRQMARAANLNKRLAPIVCRSVENSELPEMMRRLNFIFFDEPGRFEASTDQLVASLQFDLAWIEQHTGFSDAARRWSASGRRHELLLRSPALEEAERWLASHPYGAPEIASETAAFVAESRRGKIWKRRRLYMFAGLFLVTASAGAAAVWNVDHVKKRLKEREYRQANAQSLTSAQERELKPKDAFKECAACPEMIVVPSGTFMMGTPTGRGGDELERPQHKVNISKPFAVAKFPLTFDEWDTCVAHGDCVRVSDKGWGRGRQPVINVSWADAQVYVAWLSGITGREYRLLTEAEYEYAARGGKQTRYPWGDQLGKNNANCEGCGSKWDKQTAPVGSFAPNGFGLHDMTNNIKQWTKDCYHNDYRGAPTDGTAWIDNANCLSRVAKSGWYGVHSYYLRPEVRYQMMRDYRYDNTGMRVARSLAP